MSAFPDWQKYVIKQKRPATGCIPTGFEMILRAAGVAGVDFTTFQDEFDLDKDLQRGEQPRNNFGSVARAVESKYPQVHLKTRVFAKGEGINKLAAVEAMISRSKPVLISLTIRPEGGWHIMSVVDATDDSLTLLWSVDDDGSMNVMVLPKSDFVHTHDNFPGGDDIAFLAEGCV